MAITFNTNVSALTSQRYLGIAADKTASSLAKLSSGSRVPTAKDDAAALAIGTKLKAEVTSLNQAGNNAAQAVTLLQIADGALSTTSDILNRMKSLAVQASSGQLADAERSLLNQEFQNLKDEVDRIAGVTNFNGNVLLNGGDVAVAQTESKNGGLSALGIDAKFDGASIGDGDAFRVTYAYTAPTNTNGTDEDAVGNLTVTNLTTGESQTIDISAMIRAKTGQARDTTGEGALGDGVMTTDLSAGQTVEVNFAAVGVTLTLNDNFNVDASIDGAVAEVGAAGTAAAGTLAAVGNYVFNTAGGASGITDAGIAELRGLGIYDVNTGRLTLTVNEDDDTTTETMTISGSGLQFSVNGGTWGTDTGALTAASSVRVRLGTSQDQLFSFDTAAITTGTYSGDASAATLVLDLNNYLVGTDSVTSNSKTFSFKVGTGVSVNDDISFTLDGVSASTLGINNSAIDTQSGASAAIDAVGNAITTVASRRADIGANQSRLDFAAASVAVAIENTTAAQSALMDVDVSSEMTEFTSQQVLLQAGISLLAQANQQPGLLLRLLQ